MRKGQRLKNPTRKTAVIYARVSSKEQEKEGFSIPAQLKLLTNYAAATDFPIEFTASAKMMKPRKLQKQGSKDEGPLINRLRRGQNPIREDGVKWQSLQKEDRRILFDVFFKRRRPLILIT